jgi:hypothetical protein
LSKEHIEVPRATLDFYKYKEDDLIYYEFNATECSPPEPMVNAINGLKMLKNKNERLVGYFFHEPFPLFEKLPNTFSYKATELESGDFKVVFQLS